MLGESLIVTYSTECRSRFNFSHLFFARVRRTVPLLGERREHLYRLYSDALLELFLMKLKRVHLFRNAFASQNFAERYLAYRDDDYDTRSVSIGSVYFKQ